ncbi:MAG TPA: hypothetical protein ENJ19_04170 [Gammaproteobacteria bacterium]|nr:hypothetical protein [Gammaproteobacteria bacterium]
MVGLLFCAPLRGAPAEVFGVDLPLRESPASTYYIAAYLPDYGELSLMVDTGSTYTVINSAVFAALEKKNAVRHLKNLSGVMADGSKQQVPIYHVRSLRLGERCYLNDIEVAVLPGAGRNILGIKTLKSAAPFSFSLNPPRLQLSACRSALNG